MEYPIKKYDELNRLIYVDWNGIERVIMTYWENTKQVKIKYRLFYQDQEVIVYDRFGKTIVEKSQGSLKLTLPRLIIFRGQIAYAVSPENITLWRQKILAKNLV
jgi:hypothetical protein